MNLFDLNTNNIIMIIDGQDIEMRHPICFDKVYDKWLVSECGKVWSISRNKLIRGHKKSTILDGKKYLKGIDYNMTTGEDWWGDGSGCKHWRAPEHSGREDHQRHIAAHKMIMDTWAPLYDNPPEGISWEHWKIVRKLDTVYNYINKTGSIDHIDNNPANNHLNNLRRVNDWDNNSIRKLKGLR